MPIQVPEMFQFWICQKIGRWFQGVIPSGKHTKIDGKSPCLILHRMAAPEASMNSKLHGGCPSQHHQLQRLHQKLQRQQLYQKDPLLWPHHRSRLCHPGLTLWTMTRSWNYMAGAISQHLVAALMQGLPMAMPPAGGIFNPTSPKDACIGCSKATTSKGTSSACACARW